METVLFVKQKRRGILEIAIHTRAIRRRDGYQDTPCIVVHGLVGSQAPEIRGHRVRYASCRQCVHAIDSCFRSKTMVSAS
jgi:hypothetical protein